MCKISDMVFFENLNKDLFECTDTKERLILRNAILSELMPVIEHTVARFSHHNAELAEDLFQSLVEHLLNDVIYKWKPSNKSTEGYYRKCIKHRAINFLSSQDKLDEIEVATDPKDTNYWESLGCADNAPQLIEDTFILPEDMIAEAYEEAKEILLAGGTHGGKRGLIGSLKKEYDIGRVLARDVYNQALVTCREMYSDNIEMEETEVDESSLFGRLVKYLEDEQVNRIIKIFGGVWIKIPEGKTK